MEAEEYITIEEAMQQLGIRRATMFKLLKERDVTRYKAPGDRRVLILRRDFEELRKPVPRPKRQAQAPREASEGKVAA